MIDDDEIPTQADQPEVPTRSSRPVAERARQRERAPRREWRPPWQRTRAQADRGRFWRRRRGPRTKPRVRKLRLFLILIGLGALAVVSTMFGMMMAVASDLPQIENRQVYPRRRRNSYLYDDHWHLIGQFAPPNHEVIDSFQQISPWMRRRDRVGRGQALLDRPRRRPARDRARGRGRRHRRLPQGASTIAEQFVKNALAEQDNRTIFEKLREAALASTSRAGGRSRRS